jgi:hypothetical protein
MPTAKWSAPASATVATTALNSLAAGAYSGVLTEIDNTTNRYLYGDLEVLLGADLTCAAGTPYIGVFLIPTLDGTNYPNPPSGTGAVPASYQVGAILGNASATFRRGFLRGIVLPPFKFKLNLYHVLHGSTAWNSTGNVATLYQYGEEA